MKESRELQELVTIIRSKRMAKSPPGKLLSKIYLEIERKKHYMGYRCWELLVEQLATYLGITKTKDMKLFRELKPLLEHYIIAAQNNPWDHIGQLYMDQGLTGPGQNMTPRFITEMMCKMTIGEKSGKKVETVLDPCVGSGRFLISATLLFPEKPLVLFGIEIVPSLYRACLVNMKMFSNHPYYILCADSLRIDNKNGMDPRIWKYANTWEIHDVSQFYWKPPPIWHDRFSLKAFTELKEK